MCAKRDTPRRQPRRTTLEPEEDDILGAAEGGALQPPAELWHRRGRRDRLSFGVQQAGEREPQRAQPADAQPGIQGANP